MQLLQETYKKRACEYVAMRKKLRESGVFTAEEVNEIALAVYHWERTKLLGVKIKPQEGTRICKRVAGYFCGGADGPHHSECQNQPIITYDPIKAVKGQ